MKIKDMRFTIADTIAGYVVSCDYGRDTFVIETSDGRQFDTKLTANTFAEMVRNLGEAYADCTGIMRDLLEEGRFVYAHGIFFPEGETLKFEAKHLVFLGEEVGEFRFEQQDWWTKQVKQLGDFFLHAEFGDGPVDFRKYRTNLSLEGEKTETYRQETDTISRLVYGFASAYLMTGDDRYLEAAEAGTRYLRKHMRCMDAAEKTAFWYHAVDIKGDSMRKVFASEFGDDYDAIPAYEQIYALAGPTQTYRITGDPAILEDVEMTLDLFDKYFYDAKRGGYFSHIDPVTFDPRAESLTRDAARKNWNSVGDHAPAYLINIWLATENPRFGKMLVDTAETITLHFQDYDNSPFVQEKFHEDWSPDRTWGWQQNRAVVGHNLKIAWNLTRINAYKDDPRFMDFANRIALLMPKAGGDPQRGGWYDVVERTLGEGEEFHRFAWHDRKAWWQQEQGILAYLILAGCEKRPEYLKLARESAAFYNTWFLDHDSGGIYFNVLANGLPYLLGTERLKGSHSMSGYHSFELAYLASVYTNLLITQQHIDLYFKPYPNGFKDNVLRVAPDILPKGSIQLAAVWVDDKPYDRFDADAMTVTLPESSTQVRVKVRIVPVSGVEHFSAALSQDRDMVKIVLDGVLDHSAVPKLRSTLSEMTALKPKKVALIMNGVVRITNEAVRSIIFAKQKLDIDAEVLIVGANETVSALFASDELSEEVKSVPSL